MGRGSFLATGRLWCECRGGGEVGSGSSVGSCTWDPSFLRPPVFWAASGTAEAILPALQAPSAFPLGETARVLTAGQEP